MGGKWLSDLPRGQTGARVRCYVREEETALRFKLLLLTSLSR